MQWEPKEGKMNDTTQYSLNWKGKCCNKDWRIDVGSLFKTSGICQEQNYKH